LKTQIQKKKSLQINPPDNKKTKPKKKKNKFAKVSEEEFLRVLDVITRKLIHKFRFGYHSTEDMKQQASIFALEGLDKYDHKRPLENFLWTHVRNRLFNFKRNNYQRPDIPCVGCKFYDKHMKKSTNGCLEFSNKLDCEIYKNWYSRNENKKNIMQPSYIDNDQDFFYKGNNDSWIANKEIVEFLDKNISSDFREYYLKLKHGVKINKDKMEKLKAHISNLLAQKDNNEEKDSS